MRSWNLYFLAIPILWSFLALATPEMKILQEEFNNRNFQTHVVSDGKQFAEHISKLFKNADNVVLINLTGFSGAGIESNDKYFYLDMLIDKITRINANTKILLIGGGTLDGFGVFYDKINELKKEGLLKNVITSGIMSRAGAKYAKYMPEMDILWLVNSFTEKDGSTSWEVKESPSSPSITIEVLDLLAKKLGRKIRSIDHHVVEGGLQAIKEAGELVGRMTDLRFLKEHRVNLYLHTDVLPGTANDPSKDKGFYAATSIILFLNEIAQLSQLSALPSRLNVIVQPNFRTPDPTNPSIYGKTYELDEFLAKGHDGNPSIKQWLNRNFLLKKLNDTSKKILEIQTKHDQAEEWNNKYPGERLSNYYKSKKYFSEVLSRLKLSEVYFTSFLRVVDKLEFSRDSFSQALNGAIKSNRCEPLIK